MLRHALEAQGHTVVEAMDEPSAIQRMQQARPVVVLTDLKLPEGDGFGVGMGVGVTLSQSSHSSS